MSCHFCKLLSDLDNLPRDELVAQFRNSVVLLAPWQYFTGYCILVSRVHATELFELSSETRQELLEELTHLARVLHAEFLPRKINYELLGNQVPHIHWHIIPRYESDPDHLKPVWLAIERAELDSNAKKHLLGFANRSEIADRIRQTIQSMTK